MDKELCFLRRQQPPLHRCCNWAALFVCMYAILEFKYSLRILQDTLRPIYHRFAWSMTCAFEARRPKVGPNGESHELGPRQRKLAGTPLHKSCAMTEFRGDWKYHVQCFSLSRWWKCNRVCHKCDASQTAQLHGTFEFVGTFVEPEIHCS